MASGMFGVIKVIRQAKDLAIGSNVVELTRPDGTVVQDIYRNVNLLADKAELGPHYLAGRATITFSWSAANILVTKFERLVDAAWVEIFSDATGIATNAGATTLDLLFKNQPVSGSEKFRITINNTSGGIVSGGYFLSRYEVGISQDRAIATPVL